MKFKYLSRLLAVLAVLLVTLGCGSSATTPSPTSAGSGDGLANDGTGGDSSDGLTTDTLSSDNGNPLDSTDSDSVAPDAQDAQGTDTAAQETGDAEEVDVATEDVDADTEEVDVLADTDAADDAATDDADDGDDAATDDADDAVDAPDTDTATACPGNAGCGCASDADCGTGVCHLRRNGSSTCATPCAVGCPSGQVCNVNSNLCIERDVSLCDPCSQNADCGGAIAGDLCVSAGKEGSFCAIACDDTGACPTGSTCSEVSDVAGQLGKQCVPTSAAVCSCSGRAIVLKLKTLCLSDSSPCLGSRACLADGSEGAPTGGGLSVCLAKAASTEVCDGQDNDCDGQIDNSGLCADGNPCTDDSCDPSAGCVNMANSASCSDSNACTVGDSCSDSQCLPGSATVCDDSNACTDDSCDAANGCVFLANTATCTDNNACTSGDLCADSLCQPGSAVTCNDNNPCTDDSCDITAGCIVSANTVACSDDNLCTSGDLCADSLCQPGSAIPCNDNNPCTDDSCDPAQGCVFAANTAPCSDDNACTTGDICKASQCQAGAAANCDDSNLCTTDLCDPGSGCILAANTLPCTDGSACTVGDACLGSQCIAGLALGCDDSNVCTSDSCDISKGCVFLANDATCSDGSACTSGDVCSGSKCQAGSAVECDDNNVCTSDSCDVSAGCVNLASTATCSDGNACTAGDSCQDSACQAGQPVACGDGNLCTDDSCDASTGCVNLANAATCSDGSVCTLSDACSEATCKAGTAQSCDDSNACTIDSCDAIKGCQHTLMTCGVGFACQLSTGACSAKVVISEFAVLSATSAGDEFVELYNPGDTAASLKGLQIQYRSATGTIWANKLPTGGVTDLSIPAHGYFLITSSSTYYTGSAATDFSATADLAFAAAGGAIQTTAGTTILDMVGYGSATTYEGSGAATVHTGSGSMERKATSTSSAATMGSGGLDEFLGNGYDSDNNTGDFTVRTARQPQNSLSATEKL